MINKMDTKRGKDIEKGGGSKDVTKRRTRSKKKHILYRTKMRNLELFNAVVRSRFVT